MTVIPNISLEMNFTIHGGAFYSVKIWGLPPRKLWPCQDNSKVNDSRNLAAVLYPLHSLIHLDVTLMPHDGRCQQLRLLRKASCWQLIQNSVPSIIMWHQCDIQISQPNQILELQYKIMHQSMKWAQYCIKISWFSYWRSKEFKQEFKLVLIS